MMQCSSKRRLDACPEAMRSTEEMPSDDDMPSTPKYMKTPVGYVTKESIGEQAARYKKERDYARDRYMKCKSRYNDLVNRYDRLADRYNWKDRMIASMECEQSTLLKTVGSLNQQLQQEQNDIQDLDVKQMEADMKVNRVMWLINTLIERCCECTDNSVQFCVDFTNLYEPETIEKINSIVNPTVLKNKDAVYERLLFELQCFDGALNCESGNVQKLPDERISAASFKRIRAVQKLQDEAQHVEAEARNWQPQKETTMSDHGHKRIYALLQKQLAFHRCHEDSSQQRVRFAFELCDAYRRQMCIKCILRLASSYSTSNPENQPAV